MDNKHKKAGETVEKEELERRKKVLLELINDKQYVPMKIKELAILLDVPKARRAELKEVLDSLLSEGRLSVSKKGKYAKPEASSLMMCIRDSYRPYNCSNR